MSPTSSRRCDVDRTQRHANVQDFVSTRLAEQHQIEWRRSITSRSSTPHWTAILPAFWRERSVSSITKADVLAFRAKLADKTHRRQVEQQAHQQHPRVLRQIMAEADHMSSSDANVKTLKIQKSDVQPFTLDEVQRMLAVVRADWRDYFLVRFFTGMRTGGAHGLKMEVRRLRASHHPDPRDLCAGEDEYTKTDSSQRGTSKCRSPSLKP